MINFFMCLCHISFKFEIVTYFNLAEMSTEELDRMLHRNAISMSKIPIYKRIIMEGGLRQPGCSSRVLLMGAIILKRMDVIKQMAADIRFYFQESLLNISCQYGDRQIIEFYLKKYEYDVNDLYHAIIYAAKGGKQDVIDYLINELGVDVNPLCLPHAAFEGHLDVVKFFAERDASNIQAAISNAYKSPNKPTKGALIEYLENFNCKDR